MSREHGTRERYVRGPGERDEPGTPCRCTECRRANADEQRHVYRMRAYGQWKPYVDAGPARQHIRFLARHGIKPKRAAELAGIPPQHVAYLLNGRPRQGRPPALRIRAATAEAILAVRPDPALLKDAARVDATGTRRRLQALAALGWTQAKLAARLGMDASNISIAIRATGVRADTARKVAALYEQAWDQPPPAVTPKEHAAAAKARENARARGWLPPMAWDDDEIDNPGVKPKPRRVRQKVAA